MKNNLLIEDQRNYEEILWALVVKLSLIPSNNNQHPRTHMRHPKTTIAEWRGTCSGKHYLLFDLVLELGLF